MKPTWIGCAMAIILPAFVHCQEKAEPKVRPVPNPLSYSSLLLQNNLEVGQGAVNRSQWTLQLMPMVPIKISPAGSVMLRAVFPVIARKGYPAGTSQAGVGDLLVSAFYAVRTGNWITGAGPSVYAPTAMPRSFGVAKWGLGPSAIFAVQRNKFMAGAFAVHLWSTSAHGTQTSLNYSFIQPVVQVGFRRGWAVVLTDETGHDWVRRITYGSVMAMVQKSFRIIGPVSLSLGPKLFYGNYVRPSWGLRASVVLVFLKR